MLLAGKFHFSFFFCSSSGSIPPYNDQMWEDEFERYRAFPEFKQLRNADTFDLAGNPKKKEKKASLTPLFRV
jgi:hypothetical protein